MLVSLLGLQWTYDGWLPDDGGTIGHMLKCDAGLTTGSTVDVRRLVTRWWCGTIGHMLTCDVGLTTGSTVDVRRFVT